MKKGLYFIFSDINQNEPDGIEKKMMAQRQMFCDMGIDMSFERLEYKYGTDWNYKKTYSSVDFIYFRKETVIDWRMILFLKRLKKNGNPVVFMEIPTFPYDGEFGKSLRSRITLSIDHYFRKKLHRYIDRIVVTGCDAGTQFEKVKTICVVNGIDLKTVPVRDYKPHGNCINLTCVAKFSPWHGYERLIKGLYDYYRNRGDVVPVKLLMVGDGVEKDFYQSLVRDYHLEEHVQFLGKLTGENLEDIYNQTDIGICSLGRYKSGIDIIGDLKSRDLMAKGIPMVCGCQIDILKDREFKYALFIPNNDSTVSIPSVLSFYQKITSEKPVADISKYIRDEAERLIDYSRTYKPVLMTVKELLWKM